VELCKKSVRGLNILLIIVVGTVLIELYGNISLSAMKWGRSAGFAEANQFAAYLVLMLPLILTNFFLQKKITNKLSKGIFLFLTLLALISTVSRGGYIAFIACCLAFVALAYKNRMISGLRIFTFMIMTVAFVGTSYFVTPEKIKGIVQQRVEISQEKRFKDDEYAAEHSWLWKFSSGRSEIWLNCIKFFTESPIYGYGHEADKTILKIEPHNSFFIYLLNYGLIGFTFFIMMFYFIFKQIYSRFVSTTDDYSEKIYLAFLAGFIGYVVAMIGVDLYIPRYIFWIYAAIVCRYAILAPSGSINITKSAIT
jgi:O-antigen ligase